MTLASFATSWLQVMSRPWAVFAGLAAGIGIGLASRDVAAVLAPVGTLYITLLKMLVLPFMMSAITVSLARLLGRGGAQRQVSRIVATFVAAMVVAALVGVTTGVVLAPGRNLGQGAMASLGQMVNSSKSEFAADYEISLSQTIRPPNRIEEVTKAVNEVIPDNIFNALSLGDNLKVVIFSLLFGLAVGATPRAGTDALTGMLETVFRSCQGMMRAINTLLPVALCAMVAPLVAEFGHGGASGPLRTMIMFVGAQVAGAMVLYLISAVTIGRRTGSGLWGGIVALREPTVMAFGTRNSIACIPSVIDKLSAKLRLVRSDLELVVPLGISLCRFGPVMYYGVATLFISQLYDIHLSVAQLAFVLVTSMLAGVASSGSNGTVTIALLALVCGPLGLPIEAAMALFIAVDPILDACRTVLTVHGTCAISTLVCQQEREALP